MMVRSLSRQMPWTLPLAVALLAVSMRSVQEQSLLAPPLLLLVESTAPAKLNLPRPKGQGYLKHTSRVMSI
ncbi:hypothetical protein BC629DRAFT_1502205 [Irpex lacteus]|nr:hypothetical protein BC629DRAFT_1502205 [Irpex lacteus]